MGGINTRGQVLVKERWQKMENGGEAAVPQPPTVEPGGEGLRQMKKIASEIAPRRSPVRVRLAPSTEVPAYRLHPDACRGVRAWLRTPRVRNGVRITAPALGGRGTRSGAGCGR